MTHISENELISRARAALLEFKDIVDSVDQTLIQKSPRSISVGSPSTARYITYYWPDQIEFDQDGGFKLKDGVGTFSFSETYIPGGRSRARDRMEKVAHVYKFHSNTSRYFCLDASGESDNNPINYNYHFDQDLNYAQVDGRPPHSSNHLQVLHTLPRFKTTEMSIWTFLSDIKTTFYKESGTRSKVYEGILEPLHTRR